MTDYAPHLIAARKALQDCEKAVNAGDYLKAQHFAEACALQAIQIEQWCDAKLRNHAHADGVEHDTRSTPPLGLR